MAHETQLSEQALNVKFVYEIKKRPCLYNPDLMSFSRKDITDQAWEDVGKIMNMTGGACKEKWRNLRIVYIRHMKSSRYSGTGRRKRRYYLSDAMQFLLPFMKISPPGPIKKSIDEEEREKTFYDAYRFNKNIDDVSEEVIPVAWKVPVVKIETDDDHSNDTSTNQDSEGIPTRNISVEEPVQYNFLKDVGRMGHSTPCFVMNSDPIRSFLTSLLPELNEMNGSQFKSFKRRVLALIDDITDGTGTGTVNNLENVTNTLNINIK